MSNYFITGFDTTLNDTVNYVDLGQVFMDMTNNQTINGLVGYQSNPINRSTENNPARLVNKAYVDNANLGSTGLIFQAVTFTSMVTPINFTNTIQYSTNVLITNTDITFKQNNLYNALNNDQIYSFGAGSRVNGATAGGGMWVMGGQSSINSTQSTMAYSYDGFNWYPIQNTPFTTYCTAIGWNGSIWVAMGQGTNGLAYSYDGINWTGLGTSVFQSTPDVLPYGSFAWNGIMWVGFGCYTGTANNFIYSYDGIQWFGNGQGNVSGSALQNKGGIVIWNGTLFVLGTNNQTSNYNILFSYDGLKWFYAYMTAYNSSYCNAIAWNGSIWTCPASNNYSYWSRDGIIWTTVTGAVNWNASSSYPSYCLWTGAYFLACGPGNNYNLGYAYTGIGDWITYASGAISNNGLSMIAFNGTQYLGPTAQNTNQCYIGYSGYANERIFAYQSNLWPFSTRGLFACWGGRRENYLYLPQTRTLALGAGINASIAYSLDGSANWTGGNVVTSWGSGSLGNYYQSNKSSTMFYSGNGAAWNGAMWVAAGTPNPIPLYTTLLTTPIQNSLDFRSNTRGTTVSFFSVANTSFNYPGQNTWTNNAYTIEAWVKIAAAGALPTSGTMGIAGAFNTNFNMGVTTSGFLTVGGATANDTFTLNDNAWHYVAVTVNSGVTNGSFYYVDGVQRPTTFTTTLVPGNYSSNPFCVGTWSTLFSNNNNFIGEIAEIRVWNYTVSAVQISTIWRTNVSAASNGLVAYFTNFPNTPTTGTISGGASLTNSVSGASNLSFTLGGSNNVVYDTVNKPTLYDYSLGNILSPQHTLAYSHIQGNTILGNAGNLWTGMGNYTFSVSANNIAWNGNVWVAVGQGANTLAYSPDGFTWFGLGNSIFYYWGNSLAWNGTYWVAVGAVGPLGGNTMAYSPDGVQWTGMGNSQFTSSGNGVNWNGTMWVATGSCNGAAGTAISGCTMAYSLDTFNWTGLGNRTFAIQGNDVASNVQGTMWVAAGQGSTVSGIGNVLAWSSDGINWNKPSGNVWSLQNIFTIAGTSVTHNGKYWLATGLGGNSLAYSPDGNSWIGEGIGGLTYYGNRIVWNQGTGSTFIKTNYNTNTTLALTNSTCSQPLWLAAGSPYGTTPSGIINGNTLGYSRNGINWFGLGNTVFYNAGQFVAYNGTIWVAGGQGANTMAYSYNGLNWTGIGANMFTTRAYFAKWNGVIWVAVGQGGNSIGWSRDGISWTGLGAGIFSYGTTVEWNGLMWVAGGNCGGFTAYGNTLAYSFNGTNWIGLGGNVFSLACNSIVWDGYKWLGTGGSAVWQGSIALSQGNTLAYSINGYNWFNVGTPNNASFFSGVTGVNAGFGQTLAYNGKFWVAGGFNGYGNLMAGAANTPSQQGNTMIFSRDGFNWNLVPASTQYFTNVCYSVKWDGKMFVAGGQSYSTGVGGGNSIAYSYNGNTWTGIGNNVFSGNVFGVACKNLFGNKIQLDNNALIKTQTLEVVADSVYQTGSTGVSVFVNARPITITTTSLVINSNFNTTIYTTNSSTVPNSIFGWTITPLLTGQVLSIGNGTGGIYNFLNCPSPQFLIFQSAINQPILVYQSIFINPGTYTLSFYAAPRYNNNIAGFYSPTHQITASINNYNVVTNFTSNTNPWTQFTMSFTITIADNYNLQLSSLNPLISDSSIGLTEISIF